MLHIPILLPKSRAVKTLENGYRISDYGPGLVGLRHRGGWLLG